MAVDPFLRSTSPGFSDIVRFLPTPFDNVPAFIAGIVLMILNIVLVVYAIVTIVRSRKETLSKVAWIIFCVVFGIIGVVIYLLTGKERRLEAIGEVEEVKEEKVEKKIERKEVGEVKKEHKELFSFLKKGERDNLKIGEIDSFEFPAERVEMKLPMEEEEVKEISSRIGVLKDYIENALKQGFSEEKIRKALLDAGWLAVDIEKAYSEVKLKKV